MSHDTEELSRPQPAEPIYGQDGNYTVNPLSYAKLDCQENDLPAAERVTVRDSVTRQAWERGRVTVR